MTSTHGPSPSAPVFTTFTIHATRPPPGSENRRENTATAAYTPKLAAVPLDAVAVIAAEMQAASRRSALAGGRPGQLPPSHYHRCLPAEVTWTFPQRRRGVPRGGPVLAHLRRGDRESLGRP